MGTPTKTASIRVLRRLSIQSRSCQPSTKFWRVTGLGIHWMGMVMRICSNVLKAALNIHAKGMSAMIRKIAIRI